MHYIPKIVTKQTIVDSLTPTNQPDSLENWSPGSWDDLRWDLVVERVMGFIGRDHVTFGAILWFCGGRAGVFEVYQMLEQLKKCGFVAVFYAPNYSGEIKLYCLTPQGQEAIGLI